jgi:signal transduction histidine kinase
MGKDRVQWLYFILGGAAVVLFLVEVSAFLSLRNLVLYADSLDQTNKMLVKTEALISNLKEAESAQRGFLITKNAYFLKPYFRASDNKEKVISELQGMAQIKPEYAVQLQGLADLAHESYVLLDSAMPLSWAVQLTNDTLVGVLTSGSEVISSVRAHADTIKKAENTLLSKHENTMTILSRQTPINLLVLSGLAMIMFAGTFLMVIRELRMRRRYQMDLERKIEELKKSNEELEEFAYVASHDLQEPLRKLRTFGDRLHQKYSEQLPEEGQFMVDRMQSSASHMQTLIDDLLSFSRLISRGEELPFVPVDPRRVLDGVLDEYSDVIRRRAALVRLPHTMPTVTGRPTQLHQVFANLLSNSLKFSRPGQIPLVDVRYQVVKGRKIPGVKPGDAEQEFCCVEFADNGVGFDMAYKDKIFTIFQRLHNKSEYDGSGIGLSICKKIVERHNGYVDAWSEPGKGSAIYLYLPIYKEPA